MGPWGGQQGEAWAYKPDGRITEIIVRHGGVIDSLLFKSESCNGFPLEPSQKFGGSGGDRTDKVCIGGVEEYLTTISMTSGDFDGQSVVKSLSFHTNLTEYGPYGSKSGTSLSIPMEGGVIFGSKSGTSLSIPMEGGVIFGFHGRAGKYLNAIGISVAPKITSFPQMGSLLYAPAHPKTPSSVNLLVQRDPGPWGAQRGRQWDDGVFLAVKQVILRTGSTEYGHTTIELNYEGEIIVGIEGFYGPAKGTDGFEVITSISISTNKRKFGPFGVKMSSEEDGCITIGPWGGQEGEQWSYKTDGCITQIIVRHGWAVDSILFHSQSCGCLTPECSDKFGGARGRTDKNMMSSMELFVPRDPGPWGASGGKHWDDGVFSAIKKVHLNIVTPLPGCSAIKAVRFHYEKADGKCFRSPCHGGNGFPTIELDPEREEILGIEGFYGPLMEWKNGFEALTSITFYTNKRKYGPYGNEIGRHFSSMCSGGKVVGFFGRSGTHLNAIGVHMDYF
ncbi:hypothetical protein RHMOL_Rhmol06G0043400 [Rhododendron molle]|uniref:Uncharacterized protein n=1 Tax=Rhododendron molle TaxID=49168 RepID=A0ACC0N9W3_RHOML|nr:hypothetical protein RHMOL_Rhmol06G0043400 [Rhododendron molle]